MAGEIQMLEGLDLGLVQPPIGRAYRQVQNDPSMILSGFGAFSKAKQMKVLVRMRKDLNKKIAWNEKRLKAVRLNSTKAIHRMEIRRLTRIKKKVLKSIADLEAGKGKPKLMPKKKSGTQGGKKSGSGKKPGAQGGPKVQRGTGSGMSGIINVGGIEFGQAVSPSAMIGVRQKQYLDRVARQKNLLSKRYLSAEQQRLARVQSRMDIDRASDVMRGHMDVRQADLRTRMMLKQYDGYNQGYPDDSDRLMKMVGGSLAGFNFGQYETGNLVDAQQAFQAQHGPEKVWPKVGNQPIKPTDNRVAKFAMQIEKDVVAKKRHAPAAIAMRRKNLQRAAKKEAAVAAESAKKANMAKTVVKDIKSQIKVTPKANVIRKEILVKRLVSAEMVGRAHAANFAVHAATSQRFTAAESILKQAAKQPHPLVRAKVVAQAEVVEKVPDTIDIAAVAKKIAPAPPGPLATVAELTKKNEAIRANVIRGGLRGLGDAVREKRAMRNVGSFIHGLGEETVGTRMVNTPLNPRLLNASASQLDAWGRPLPGPAPREAETVNWIMNNFGSMGQFDGGFFGFDGWWTDYKKRAARRTKKRLARIKKTVKKSVKKMATDAGKAALSSTKKAAVDAASKLASKAIQAASTAAEKGLNTAISKMGGSAGDAANMPTTSTDMVQDMSVTDDPGGIPSWVKWAGIVAAVAGGGFITYKVIQGRR